VRWMHALARAAEVLEEPTFHAWAVELAGAAHSGFTFRPAPGAAPRMYWKTSIDLNRPLVPSQGAHDPLDGFVTLRALGSERLRRELDELGRMCHPSAWATDDPLGVGGLLTDAWWVAQLSRSGDAEGQRLEPLLPQLLEASLSSLQALDATQAFRLPLEDRLAFRELGLAIGLRALEALLDSGVAAATGLDAGALRWLERYEPIADAITQIWSSPDARALGTWRDHEDINDVMLATALAPDEYIRV